MCSYAHTGLKKTAHFILLTLDFHVSQCHNVTALQIAKWLFEICGIIHFYQAKILLRQVHNHGDLILC